MAISEGPVFEGEFFGRVPYSFIDFFSFDCIGMEVFIIVIPFDLC